VQNVNGSKHTFNLTGAAPAPTPTFNAWAREAGGWATVDDIRGWGQSGSEDKLTAFSSWSNQAGSSFGVGGWGDRSASFRGWNTHGGTSGWGIGGHATGMHW
jgi:hypothetical protein